MSSMPALRGLSEQLRLFARAVPRAEPLDVHAISRPARTYTGDFYFTHRYEDRLWILNPGSPTDRRREPAHTMIVLRLRGGRLTPELVTL